MAYEMVMPYHLHMPSYFLETFTEYPYLMENYSDCLCHDCLKAVKDSFYACEINPRYNKKKNDKERIDCKQR